MENIDEQVSKSMVEKLGIIVTGREDDLKAQVLVKLQGERLAYEAVFKVPRDIFDPDLPELDMFFNEAKKAIREVIEGRKEMNAIVS